MNRKNILKLKEEMLFNEKNKHSYDIKPESLTMIKQLIN